MCAGFSWPSSCHLLATGLQEPGEMLTLAVSMTMSNKVFYLSCIPPASMKLKHLIPHSSWQFFLNHPLKGTANYLNLRDFTLNKFQFLFSLGKWKYLVILDLGFPVTTNGDSWVTAVSMVAMHLSCFLIQVASLIYIPSLAPMGLWLCDLCSRQ